METEISIGALTEGFKVEKMKYFDIDHIKQEVYDFFRVSKSEIEPIYFEKIDRRKNNFIRIHQPGSRARTKVEIRQIAMAICYDMKSITKWSLGKIGNEIGGYDHSTVLYAIKTVRNLYDTDRKYRDNFDKLQLKIKEKFQI